MMMRLLLLLLSTASFLHAHLDDVPVAYGGRYRPFEAYARLWLQDVYGRPSLRASDLASFQQETSSATELILRMHFLGREAFTHAPLYAVPSAKLKVLLGLDPKTATFSAAKLQALNLTDEQRALVPDPARWPELRMLPAKRNPGEWLPLDQLTRRSGNFTAYSDTQFEQIANAYRAQNIPQLAQALREAYGSLAGQIIRESPAGPLRYPSIQQLQAEVLYYRLPLIPLTIACYVIGVVLLLATRATRIAMGCLLLGWVIHTGVLALRCYILARPPVSNMFETLLFVPWVSMVVGLVWNRPVLAAAAITSTLLLALLQVTQLNSALENVQAVLNSQYWLIIHVLMIVSSYGVFTLCGLLGHAYLIGRRPNTVLGDSILHTMYLGTALLIPGTILGGVWAAQSWGRFWDWDPKESWAFITSCLYLIVIHAYRFHKIGHFGLAIGSVLGLVAVSFTWYGVNYILGSGLHSYGFGSGGEVYYYAYVVLELGFVGFCSRSILLEQMSLNR